MSVPVLIGTVEPVRSGSSRTELVVLGPSLGTTTELWSDVATALARDRRVLRFDLPGHGASPAAAEACTVPELAAAVIQLVDSVGGGPFSYAGISLGGAIGLQLALDFPNRVRNLAVVCSGAKIGSTEAWRERAAQVRASGTASVVAGSAQRWFAPGFLDADPGAGSAALAALLDIDDESYARCCEALAVFDVTDRMPQLNVPTLCVAGQYDLATPEATLVALAAAIPGARQYTLPGVGHLPALEAPTALTALLEEFLDTPPGQPATAAEGMLVRRAVLGTAHVDAANAAITPETADFQDFLTRYAWGEVWSRPGLDRRSRSLLTLAALITGGHERELAMHFRAGLTNGLSRAELSEAVLHTGLYAGLPAANTASAILRGVLAELDQTPDTPPVAEPAPAGRTESEHNDHG